MSKAEYPAPHRSTKKSRKNHRPIPPLLSGFYIMKIGGNVYTQATDIEDERNGIIDFSTGELKVADGLLNVDKHNVR